MLAVFVVLYQPQLSFANKKSVQVMFAAGLGSRGGCPGWVPKSWLGEPRKKPWLVGLYRGLYYPGMWGL